MDKVFNSNYETMKDTLLDEEQDRNSKIHHAKENLLWNFNHFKLPIEYHEHEFLNDNVKSDFDLEVVIGAEVAKITKLKLL